MSKLVVMNGDYKLSETDQDAIRSYSNEGKLISLMGKNKNGEVGQFVDIDGLCEHERVTAYCVDCGERMLTK